MDDALLVRRFEARRNLPRDRDGFVERQRTLQVGAFDQFHDERALLDAINRRDIGMIQRGQHLGFALESRHVLRIVGQGRGQDLDRDVAVQLGVVGAINLAHAAGAKRRHNFVRAEFVARRKGHASNPA